ncbi:MAG: RNB domain-containing ribonuclease [Paludibacteraceae bacterium]|nr:RNB domain-containing ribonuclease [Paludibacteraceae bacterium]
MTSIKDDIAQEILRRRDMREPLTFTIDPADAKDFDDALSFESLGDGLYQIGVHIADVTHYVQPDTDIDDEAYRRGTTIYEVNRVTPMLPERLCNDLCSLRPNEDKLTMSVIFTMTADAKVVKHKICRTVIRSDFRLTYEQAQSILDGEADPLDAAGLSVQRSFSDSGLQLTDALCKLNLMALSLRRRRIAAGALCLDKDEPRFLLDKNGHPTAIYFESPTPAHHLIEEFMLLANRTIAKQIGGLPFVYRVHDLPNQEKMRQVEQFKRKMKDRVRPEVIDLLTIRAMAKAEYSTHNIGHYGLRFTHYTHFTSPIRRYPDMMVHRLVDKYILRAKPSKDPKTETEILEQACKHCSEMELMAQEAERASVKLYQTLWMNDHKGEVFEGTISGVTDFGLFVELNDSRCEGLIHIYDIIPGEYMLYDEKNYRLIGETTGKTFTMGDPMRVQVVKVDIDHSQIDFMPIE